MKRRSKPAKSTPANPEKRLPDKAHEAFAQLLARGRTQASSFREVYPRSKTWKDVSVWTNSSDLAALVSPRVQWLQEQSAGEGIISVIERKRILSEIALGNVADYLGAGKDGAWVDFGPESKNPRSVASVKSRTTEDEAVITELRMRDPVQAIHELNDMEGVGQPEKFTVPGMSGSGPVDIEWSVTVTVRPKHSNGTDGASNIPPSPKAA